MSLKLSHVNLLKHTLSINLFTLAIKAKILRKTYASRPQNIKQMNSNYDLVFKI